MNADLKRILGLDNVKRTPIESCIHGEYKEGSLGLADLAATELATIIAERDEARELLSTSNTALILMSNFGGIPNLQEVVDKNREFLAKVKP